MERPRTKGVGIDLISIARLKKIKKSDFDHWRHVFSVSEWRSAFQYLKPPVRLAEIFAAKEAAMKASGHVGVKNFNRFEVRFSDDGLPVLGGLYNAVLSISHNKNMVIAVVLVL